MSKHTPTPWQFKAEMDDHHVIVNTKGEFIAEIPFDEFDEEDQKTQYANTEHIVKCVNAFPALVEALEFCLSKIGQPHSIEIKDDLEKIETLLHSLKSEG